jgi:hypothetical protein
MTRAGDTDRRRGAIETAVTSTASRNLDISGDEQTVTVDLTEAAQFFRLRQA